MNAKDAIYKVLLDAGEPLSTNEITRRILEAGLWSTQGKTPEATISATLSSDIKEHGPVSRFQHTGPSQYGLNSAFVLAPEIQKPKQTNKILASVPENPIETATYSFTGAAEFVLRKYSNNQPMHYQAITDQALELKLLSTKGLTPEATMYAQIITEIERRKKRGEQPRFIMHGKGLVGLTVWEPLGIPGMIENHNRAVREQLLSNIQEMPATEFERLIAHLFATMGFEDVNVTPYSGDKGIDVKATLVVGDSIRTKMAIQVKKWKNNIQAPTVQQVRGSLNAHEQGLIITTSDFSSGAVAEASSPNKLPVALINGERLVELLIENDIGVSRTSHDLIEIGDLEINP